MSGKTNTLALILLKVTQLCLFYNSLKGFWSSTFYKKMFEQNFRAIVDNAS